MLRSLLLSDDDVVALVGANVATPGFSGRAPLPGIVIGAPPTLSTFVSGFAPDVLRAPAVKVTCYAGTSLLARSLFETARLAILGLSSAPSVRKTAWRAVGIEFVLELAEGQDELDVWGADKGTPICWGVFQVFSTFGVEVSEGTRAEDWLCCLAVGEAASTTADAASAGTTDLTLADSTDFEEGDVVFGAESDGTEVERLGLVTDVDGDVVTVSYSLASAKSAGWLVWTPSASLVFPYEVLAVRSRFSGIVRLLPCDGLPVNQQMQGSVDIVTLKAQGVWASSFSDLVSFLTGRSGADSGNVDVALAFWDEREGQAQVAEARLISEVPEFPGIAMAPIADFELVFAIANWDTYPGV